MLAIQKPRADTKPCTPNIIPCRIQYNGPTKVTKRFWNSIDDTDGTQTAHFRGRRLRGRVVKLPAAYQGHILQSTEKILPQPPPRPHIHNPEDDEDDHILEIEEPPEPVKIVESLSQFDEMVIWGHDQLPGSDDTFVKGIEEWISLAEAIHGTPTLSLEGGAEIEPAG